MKLPVVLGTALLLIFACGSGTKAPSAARKSTQGAAAPDPLAGLSLAEICKDDSLSMIKWRYAELQQGFAKLCCVPGGLPADEGVCTLDWPFSDVPACAAYDELRNGIMARYGYPFEKGEWRRRYEGQSWYQRREDFDASWLSPAAKHNVETLKRLKADKVACSP